MPAPIDTVPQYTRSFYNAPLPKQEVYLDLYDFQSVLMPENEGVEPDHSQKLESSFCRDFACCGLVLENLHDLLQHYEEYHVRFEDDMQGNSYEEEWSDHSAPSSPAVTTKYLIGNVGGINGVSNSNGIVKRKATASLSDIYAEEMAYGHDDSSAFGTSVLRPSSSPGNRKKRNFAQIVASNSLDMATPCNKRLNIATDNLGTYSELPTPTEDELLSHSSAFFIPANNSAATTGNFMITTEELMVRKQEALNTMGQRISRTSSALLIDKPYKCPVIGCDKAYKNPNGLKYHNQHGHCSTQTASESDKPSLKPYQCTVANCGKRYKNLNGLKYHIEHHHVPSSTNGGQITPVLTPAVSSMPTPITTPLSSPIMTPIIPKL